MDNRDNTQPIRTEPRIEPVIGAAGDTTHIPAGGNDYPEAGDMPAWLREPAAEPSLAARYGRQALIWGAALLAVGGVAAGGLYLRNEQKAHSELDAIAMSSRAADAAVISGIPAEPVVPAPRTITVPPLVTLPPDGSKPATPPVPPQAAPAAAVAPEVKTVEVKTADVAPAPKPAKKPVLAKAVPKKQAEKAPARALTAAKWPPKPSRKMPLAQNVLPKPKGKAAAAAKPKLAAAKKAIKPVRTAALKPKAAPKKVAGTMLPPPKTRVAAAPPPAREYPRDPVPIPRSCAKGELARDCAN